MKITKEHKDDVRKLAEKAAKSHKGKVVDRGDNFAIEAKGWGIEIIPEEGWAYMHGYDSLNGFSTNIADTDELGEGIKRLLAAKG
jgi:hypothetical protein